MYCGPLGYREVFFWKFLPRKYFFMQKRSFIKSPFGIAAIICFAIALISPLVFVSINPSVQKEVIKKVSPTVTIVPSKTEKESESVQGAMTVDNHSANPTPVSQDSQGQATSTTTQSTATPTIAPTSVPAVQTFQVSLSVNGSSVGSVTVDQGANQCDVLTKAKDQGKISQLLMKYVDSLGTNGVYQINGVGKDNSVWWVYKVNGQSPGQGCSYIKANSGDTVEWDYQGN